MINQIHPAESGATNIAPNILAAKAVEVSEQRVGILEDAVRAVLSSIPAPSDIVAPSTNERQDRPTVNEQFIQMVAGPERQHVDEQFDQIVAGMQAEVAQTQDVVTDPNAFISLTGDEHPNQLAIDEAMRNAMAAYDDNSVQDVRV